MLCRNCQKGADVQELALHAKQVGALNTGSDLWSKAYLLHCRGKCYCQCRMDSYDNS